MNAIARFLLRVLKESPAVYTVCGHRPEPYPQEFERTGAAFIHIPKNGGLSVLSAVYGDGFQVGHKPYRYYEELYPDRLAADTVFTTVRNPFARVFSAYTFLQAGGMNHTDKKWAQLNLREYSSFREFVYSLEKPRVRKRVLDWKHFRPQVWYLLDSSGNIGPDVVLPLEQIDQAIQKLESLLAIKIELKKINSTNSSSPHYDRRMETIVADVYEDDFRILGYPADAPYA